MTEQLKQIFNALTTISTKGEDTLVMADILRAMRNIITESEKTVELEEK